MEEVNEPSPMDQMTLVLSKMMELQTKRDEERECRQEAEDRR